MKELQQIELKDTYRVLLGRLLIIAFALSASVLQNYESLMVERKSTTIYSIFVFYSFIALIYFLIVKIFPVQRTFIFFQLIIDILIITGLASVTGLSNSIFINLFFVIIICGSIFLSFTQGLLLATIATLSISLITFAVYAEIIKILPELIDYNQEIKGSLSTIIARLITISFGMHIVAAFSGFLANNYKNESILLSEILVNLSNGVLVVDRKQKISYLNQEVCKLLELELLPEFYTGKNLDSIFTKSTNEILENLYQKKELNAEEHHLQLRNSKKFIEIRSVPIQKKNNDIKAIIFIFTDRTLQNKIKEVTKRAERLSIVNELAANIVHEIRNPIASISGAVQEVQSANDLEENDKKLLNIVLKESNRLNDIVTNFLEYSRIQSNTNKSCSLNQLILDLISITELNPKAENFKLHFNCDENYFCAGDQNQLHQVFLNLTLNSIEAQGDHGEVFFDIKKVKVNSLEENIQHTFPDQEEVILISVSDNGPGIEKDVLEKIFDPFFTTKAYGTGLGLSIVQKIVESHGGFIRILSEVDNGTNINIFLRVANR